MTTATGDIFAWNAGRRISRKLSTITNYVIMGTKKEIKFRDFPKKKLTKKLTKRQINEMKLTKREIDEISEVLFLIINESLYKSRRKS